MRARTDAGRLTVEVCPSQSLSAAELEEIWALTRQYVETDRSTYEKKLRSLSEVGLWRTPDRQLVGLASVDTSRTRWAGSDRIIIFTANAVIAEGFRGRNLVLRTGLRIWARERLRHPFTRIYWFFDSFSYKSYVLLPRNLAEFWPRRDRPTPESVRAFMDHLARQRYGDAWSPEQGVVRSAGTKRLLPTTAPIDAAVASDPDVRFFEASNPGHREGDMLVCLVPLTLRNLAMALWRALTRRRSRERASAAESPT